ncbi:MAG TPA: radical SAM protein [Verrucomicrobiae bacterium]
MTTLPTRHLGRKLRYAWSFVLGRLVHVNLQILYDCNYRCRICDFWRGGYRDHPRLTLEQAAIISDRLNEIGPQIISIGGGEPLLHPDLEAIARTLARHHFPVLITNGSLVTADKANAMWSAGLMEISVSVDYAESSRHDTQRDCPGAFDQAFRALEILHDTRTHPEQRVHLISVLMDDNLGDLERLIERCEHMGITCLLTLYSHSRGQKPPRPPAMDVSSALLEIKRRRRHFVPLRGYLERFSEAATSGAGPCQAGRLLCKIDSQGDVTFCIDRLENPAGNILREAMPGIVRRLRKQWRSNDCRGCWTSCRGSLETLRFGPHRLGNLWDYWQMTRPVPLKGSF